MPQYLLQAGNTPSLTLAEARAVVGDVLEITPGVLQFEAESDETAKKLFALLGASVRLVKAEPITQGTPLSEAITTLLLAKNLPKLKFGVAQWGDKQTERISLFEVKELLEEKGVKVRFIEGSRDGLSAAVLLHQSVIEVVVIQTADSLLVGETMGVQNIDHWTLKDRQKPYADRKKGMLPPKLARVMVNLALGSAVQPKTVVYDPFCGTGTVLLEALERGAMVIGSDSDETAAIGAQSNLAWFADTMSLPADFTVFPSDVAHADAARFPAKVDAIVTEPFLGRVQPEESALPGMFRGLEKLYLGAFRHWRSLLKEGATVVMVFPRVEVQRGKTYDFSHFVDKLQADGYTSQVPFGSLRYHRPGAVVQREIGIFTYGTR